MVKTFTTDWFDVHMHKFNILLNYFRSKENINFLEVGSFEGKSSCWFFENYILNSNQSTLTCVDTWEGSMEHSDDQKSKIWDTFISNTLEYPKEKLIIKRGLSRDVLKALPSQNYDFIYIDGSHTTRDVLEDAVLAFDLLKINGILTFDDYDWKWYQDPLLNPGDGINSFIKCYAHQIQVIEATNQLTLIKKSS
jgi:predicted O-methyltransferase YrrM